MNVNKKKKKKKKKKINLVDHIDLMDEYNDENMLDNSSENKQTKK